MALPLRVSVYQVSASASKQSDCNKNSSFLFESLVSKSCIYGSCLAVSYIGCGMCGGKVFHPDAHHLLHWWWWVEEMTSENLLAGLAEVLREERIEDGVDAGVAVGQAVGADAEGERGII